MRVPSHPHLAVLFQNVRTTVSPPDPEFESRSMHSKETEKVYLSIDFVWAWARWRNEIGAQLTLPFEDDDDWPSPPNHTRLPLKHLFVSSSEASLRAFRSRRLANEMIHQKRQSMVNGDLMYGHKLLVLFEMQEKIQISVIIQ